MEKLPKLWASELAPKIKLQFYASEKKIATKKAT